jgi:hypothetical protein
MVCSERNNVEFLACYVPSHGLWGMFGRVWVAATVPMRSKILDTFTQLKHGAARPDSSEFLDVVRTIFHLEEDSRSEVSLAIN